MVGHTSLQARHVVLAALEEDRLPQASLEVYSPPAGIKVQPGGIVQNLAQALTAAEIAAAPVQPTGR